MVADNGIHFINVNGVNLPIRSYRFDDHGAPLHVFYWFGRLVDRRSLLAWLVVSDPRRRFVQFKLALTF
jgi:hypothetical protein